MKKGWRLTFKYDDGGNVIDVELIGDDKAIRAGLNMVALMAGEKLKALVTAGKPLGGLVSEGIILMTIQQGGPVAAYQGEFLTIAPKKIAGGLQSSLVFEWND